MLQYLILGIIYKEIKHKYGFGEAYCKDLLKWILKKFTLYFSKFYFIFYEFQKLKQISRNFNSFILEIEN
jgi:hypothetical protein